MRWLTRGEILAVVAFLAIQALLYPPAIAIQDEGWYLAESYVLRGGTIFADLAGLGGWMTFKHGGHAVSLYPPGMGALLLPFTIVNWRLTFVLNPLLQVAGYLLFRRLLEDLGHRPTWAVLYLFFPPLVLFSRTLMSEVPSATLAVAALLLYGRGRRGQLAAGLLLGAALFLRYSNLALFVGLLVGVLAVDLQRRRNLAAPWLALGFLPGLVLFTVYSLIAFGQITTPGYATPLGGKFAFGYFPRHLLFYAADLLILYPLMLIAPIVYRGRLCIEVLGITGTMFLLMSAYYYLDDGHGLIENLLVGARLILPAFPAFLIAYVATLERLPLSRLALPATGLALAVMAVVLSSVHQSHLEQAARVRDTIAQNSSCRDTFANVEALKFFSPAWGSSTVTVIEHSQVPENASADVVYVNVGDQGLETASRLAAKLGDRRAAELRSDWHLVVWSGCS